MKQKNLKIGFAATLALLLTIGLFNPRQAKAEAPYGISFQVFYDELMPYGDWVKDANYGYIWLPAVRADFHPYGTNGHWVMTEYGNTWVSNYDWGWAPFHYGRWYFDDYYQSWAWIPGYDWGPAWVNWRTGGGYYGWAPLGPGVSINVRVNIPSFHWVFLPNHRIYHQHAYRYYAPRKTKIKIYNRTTIINNTVVYNNNQYAAGPSRREVSRVTRRNVPVYSVRGSNKPGRAAVSRNSLNIYQPNMTASRNRSVDARPSRVATPEQVRTARSNSRNAYSNSPSRNARGEATTRGRSATPSVRGNQEIRNSRTPAKANSKDRGFEMKPYEGSRTRTNAPSTRTQSPNNSRATTPRTQSKPTVRSTPQRSSGARVSQPQQRKQQPRTQPTQRTKASTPTSRSSRSKVSSPSQSRTKSSPQVRSSRSSNVRTAPKRTSKSSTSSARKSTSRSSSSRSSSSSRGNN